VIGFIKLKILFAIVAATALCLLTAGVSFAEEQPDPGTLLYIPPATGTIQIDGKLNDDAWARAPILFLARIGQLAPLYPATARILYDDDALYVAFESFDQDIQSNLTEHDSYVWRDGDCFELFLGPPTGKFQKIEIQINPREAVMDIGYPRESGSFDDNVAWNWPGATWKTSIDGTLNDDRIDGSWRAELRLPWHDNLPRPTADQPWTGLFTSLNRVKLADGREPRESSYWPMLQGENFHKTSEWAKLYFVPADPDDMLIEGFARATHGSSGNTNVYVSDYRGMSAGWTFVDDRVSWETQPIPENHVGPATIAFEFTTYGGKGYSDAPLFLHVGDRDVIMFDPHRPESHSWKNDLVALTFNHRIGSAHSNGVLTLTLVPELFTPGKPVAISLTPGDNSKPRVGLNVMARTDIARFEYYANGLRANNSP